MAGVLMDAGHQIRQFDWLVADRQTELLGQTIREFDPEVVAVSIRNVDRIDSLVRSEDAWELKEAKDLVASVRRFTRAPVIIGGAAVSTMPPEVRQYVGADMAVPGEGERSIVDAVAAVTQGRSLPAVWPVTQQQPRETYQRAPCFDPALVAFYWDKSGIIGLQSKRGCPYHCCYCTYPKLEGTTFRARHIEAVIADLERLKREFHVDTVFFVDSIFNDSQGQYLDLVETMAARELGVKWACYMSPHLLTREILALCKRAGSLCRGIWHRCHDGRHVGGDGQAVPMGRCRADESDVRADGNRVRPFCHFRGAAGDTNDGSGRAQ